MHKVLTNEEPERFGLRISLCPKTRNGKVTIAEETLVINFQDCDISVHCMIRSVLQAETEVKTICTAPSTTGVHDTQNTRIVPNVPNRKVL